MAHSIRITGKTGEIRWGYHTAATVGAWTIQHDGMTGCDLTAALESVDDFRLSQAPLLFQVPRPDRPPWRWPVESVHVMNGSLVARLGFVET